LDKTDQFPALVKSGKTNQFSGLLEADKFAALVKSSKTDQFSALVKSDKFAGLIKSDRFPCFSYDAVKGLLISIPIFLIPIELQKYIIPINMFFLFLCFCYPSIQREIIVNVILFSSSLHHLLSSSPRTFSLLSLWLLLGAPPANILSLPLLMGLRRVRRQ
jgi:hypothetical protein